MKFKLCPNTCIYFIDSIVYIFYTSAGPSMRLITLYIGFLNVLCCIVLVLGHSNSGFSILCIFFEISIVQVSKI